VQVVSDPYHRRVHRWIDRALFGIALVVLVFGAAGGAWGVASDHAVLATQLDRSGSAPLYGLVANVAAWLPVGEPWFRLAIVNALLGAVLLVGVARAARAVLPKDPIAGVIAAVVLALAPPIRDAAGFGGPSMLAACGAAWTIVFALEHAREPTRQRTFATLGGVLVVIGAAPWLGVALGAYVVAWMWKTADRDALVIGAAVIGATVVLWWIGAEGSLPDLAGDGAAMIAGAGRGAAAIVVGAGVLGIGFAAATDLPRARWVAGAVAIAGVHGALVDRDPVSLLALLAIGIAVIPSAIVRAVPSGAARRHVVAAIAGAPLVGAALLIGPAVGVDDPGSAPARVASDLLTPLPGGPGIIIPTRGPTWSAVVYAQAVAGSRPDLGILPRVDAATAVVAVRNAFRMGRMVGSDVPAFGELDLRNAYPRGRGYQLVPTPPPDQGRSIPPPADHGSEIGKQIAVLGAVDRARYEAVHGRLGAAARAAGLTDRFGAADLAILSTTAPSRPAFFGFIPELDDLPPGRWLIDLLGDDLAWSAGIDPPRVDSPRARRLHGLWRSLWRGEITRDDPAITALGPAAVRATAELIETFKKNRR
jgi:hypothetical protein